MVLSFIVKYFNLIVRYIFWAIIKIIVTFILGLNIRRYELLPKKGAAIIVANHNSHLDTMVLASLYPLSAQKYIKPAAAFDYFLKNKLLKWFSLNIIGIVPVRRKFSKSSNPLAQCSKALDDGNIVILYPEGSRGEPEHMSNLKSGIAHLAKKHPNIPITPIFMHGLGKALPKGEALLVPFFCDIFVGEPIYWQENKKQFMENLSESFNKLANEEKLTLWKE